MRMPTISCASSVEPAMCGVAITLRVVHELRILGRLSFKDVEPRAGHLPAFQRRQQVRFVHQFAARAVHDAHARLGKRQRFGVDQVAGLRRRRAVQADEIAGLQHFFERDQLDVLFLRQPARKRRDRKAMNRHLESLRQARHFRADLAQANQAQRLPAQFDAVELLLLPLAAASSGVGLRDAPGQRQEQAPWCVRPR